MWSNSNKIITIIIMFISNPSVYSRVNVNNLQRTKGDFFGEYHAFGPVVFIYKYLSHLFPIKPLEFYINLVLSVLRNTFTNVNKASLLVQYKEWKTTFTYVGIS